MIFMKQKAGYNDNVEKIAGNAYTGFVLVIFVPVFSVKITFKRVITDGG